MKFGCISIEEGSANISGDRLINIGDHMQLLAVLNLYRIMGVREEDIIRIEYYDMFSYSGEDVVIPINFIWFNPFWGERELILPNSIHPVFLGIHSIGDDYSEAEIDYLKKHEPIGCRDAYTYRVLKNRGVKTYLHGCLTSTLTRRDALASEGNIYMVDVPDALIPYIPESLKKNAITLSHQFYGHDSSKNSWEDVARNMLEKYRDDASMIITSRLHCASPCMALGIPVVFAHQKRASSFSWISKLLNIYTQETWCEIDWAPQTVEYETLKQQIITEDIQRIKYALSGIKQEKANDYFEVSNDLIQDFENGELMRIKQFTEKNWKNKDAIEYSFWGVTQISEHAYRYLKTSFPAAKLVNVYDNYRRIEFHGIKTKPIESYSIDDDVYLIATGNSTSIAAKKLFHEKGWEEDYLCTCYEGLYQKMEDEG